MSDEKNKQRKTRSAIRRLDGAPELGPRLKALRLERMLTLDQLATKTNISKSMLSQIERGETNPTFAIVWTLTQSLRVDLTELMGGKLADGDKAAMELLPAHYTPAITSRDGKCTLRILSPIDLASHTEWYDFAAEPGGKLESEAHSAGAVEHFTCLEGHFLVRSGENEQHLKPGDTVRYVADVPHAILNEDSKILGRGLLIVLS